MSSWSSISPISSRKTGILKNVKVKAEGKKLERRQGIQIPTIYHKGHDLKQLASVENSYIDVNCDRIEIVPVRSKSVSWAQICMQPKSCTQKWIFLEKHFS